MAGRLEQYSPSFGRGWCAAFWMVVPHAAWRILEAVGVAVGRGGAALEAEAATCTQEASKAAEVLGGLEAPALVP